jgi:hypothetical protein
VIKTVPFPKAYLLRFLTALIGNTKMTKNRCFSGRLMSFLNIVIHMLSTSAVALFR